MNNVEHMLFAPREARHPFSATPTMALIVTLLNHTEYFRPWK